jgi:hypothetical protein
MLLDREFSVMTVPGGKATGQRESSSLTKAASTKARVRRGTPRSQTPPPPLPATEQPEIMYLSGAPAETAIEAIIDDPSHWKRGADGRFIYGEENSTYIAMGDPRSALTAEQEEITWKKILALDDNTAQTFLYVMSRDLASSRDSEKTRIHVNEILEFKGYQRHKRGDFRPHMKRAEQERLIALSDMWAGVNDEIREKSGRGYRTKKIKLFSRLIELAIETEADDGKPRTTVTHAVPLPSILPGDIVPYAFRVSLGEWAKPYRSVSGLLRPVLAKIVQYDASKESQRYAMRIALCLMFGHHHRNWRLRDLLEKARIELPVHHADRFRETVEAALDRLQADQLIGSWMYVNDDGGELPGKRWLERWLDWDIAFIERPHSLTG